MQGNNRDGFRLRCFASDLPMIGVVLRSAIFDSLSESHVEASRRLRGYFWQIIPYYRNASATRIFSEEIWADICHRMRHPGFDPGGTVGGEPQFALTFNYRECRYDPAAGNLVGSLNLRMGDRSYLTARKDYLCETGAIAEVHDMILGYDVSTAHDLDLQVADLPLLRNAMALCRHTRFLAVCDQALGLIDRYRRDIGAVIPEPALWFVPEDWAVMLGMLSRIPAAGYGGMLSETLEGTPGKTTAISGLDGLSGINRTSGQMPDSRTITTWSCGIDRKSVYIDARTRAPHFGFQVTIGDKVFRTYKGDFFNDSVEESFSRGIAGGRALDLLREVLDGHAHMDARFEAPAPVEVIVADRC